MFGSLFLKRTYNPGIHLLRSVISSTFSFIVDFSVMVGLVELAGIYYLIAGSAGFLAGTSVSYIFSIIWIFPSRTIKNRYLEYIIFILIGIAGGFINILLLWIFTDKLGVYYMISRTAAAAIGFFFNFTVRKILLFTVRGNSSRF